MKHLGHKNCKKMFMMATTVILGHSGIIWGSLWRSFGAFWGDCGVTLGWLWGTWRVLWRHSVLTLSLFLACANDLGWLWCHLGCMKVNFQKLQIFSMDFHDFV